MIPVRQKFQEELLAEGVVTEQLVQVRADLSLHLPMGV